MGYASAKFAIALCDRCGFQYKLLELKKEWNNLKHCSECFEKKHPQLEPKTVVADPEALYEPRPSNDVGVGYGYVLSNNDTILGSSIEGFTMTSSLGEVTIVL